MANEKLTTLARRLRPFFVFQMEASLAALMEEGPDIDLVDKQIGRGGDTIITFDTGGNPVAEYAATSAGFDLANADSGEITWLYGFTVDGDHIIPAGRRVIGNQRDTSILSGLITMGAGSSLENLSVIRTANDATTLIGVGGPPSGVAYLRNVRVSVTQSGAGAAYAVAANAGLTIDNGDIHIHRSELEATSTGGAAYCGLSSYGRLYVWHSKADIFTTDRWLVS